MPKVKVNVKDNSDDAHAGHFLDHTLSGKKDIPSHPIPYGMGHGAGVDGMQYLQ